MSETVAASSPSNEPNTLVNALIGGLVSIVVAFVPFSPVIGGAVAGYLQGPDRSAGLRVGAYAGVVASIPFLFIAFVGVSIFAAVPVAEPSGAGLGIGLFGILAVLFVLVLTAAYSVGLSALGGYVGAYLNDEDVL